MYSSKLQEKRILNSVLIDKTKELVYFKIWLANKNKYIIRFLYIYNV